MSRPLAGDRGRLFLTALLVYALCANPVLAAGEVAALAAWLGASRRGQLWAALLFALGTPAFLFATRRAAVSAQPVLVR